MLPWLALFAASALNLGNQKDAPLHNTTEDVVESSITDLSKFNKLSLILHRQLLNQLGRTEFLGTKLLLFGFFVAQQQEKAAGAA